MKIIKEHSVTQDNYYDDTIYITNSMLSKLSEKSPAHFKYWLDNKPEPTAAMQLGSAIHSAILTPLEFTKNYVVAPDIDKRTKAGKEAWAKFVEENTKTIITYPIALINEPVEISKIFSNLFTLSSIELILSWVNFCIIRHSFSCDSILCKADLLITFSSLA